MLGGVCRDMGELAVELPLQPASEAQLARMLLVWLPQPLQQLQHRIASRLGSKLCVS